MSKEGDAVAPAGPTAEPTGQDVFAAVDDSNDDVAPASEPASGGPSVAVDVPSSAAPVSTGAGPSTGNAVASPTPSEPSQADPKVSSTGNAAASPPVSLNNPSSTPPSPKVEPSQSQPQLEPPVSPTNYSAEQMKQFETEAMAELARNYSLTPEQLAQVEAEGMHAVLPQMLARAHINMMNSAMRLIQQQAPQTFRSMYQTENAKKVFAERFFTAYPALADNKHAPVVRDILKRARALDPSMSMDDLIQVVGTQASVKLKLPLGGGRGSVTPAPTASPSPTFAPSAPAPRPTAPARQAAVPAGGVNWSELVEEDV